MRDDDRPRLWPWQPPPRLKCSGSFSCLLVSSRYWPYFRRYASLFSFSYPFFPFFSLTFFLLLIFGHFCMYGRFSLYLACPLTDRKRFPSVVSVIFAPLSVGPLRMAPAIGETGTVKRIILIREMMVVRKTNHDSRRSICIVRSFSYIYAFFFSLFFSFPFFRSFIPLRFFFPLLTISVIRIGVFLSV